MAKIVEISHEYTSEYGEECEELFAVKLSDRDTHVNPWELIGVRFVYDVHDLAAIRKLLDAIEKEMINESSA